MPQSVHSITQTRDRLIIGDGAYKVEPQVMSGGERTVPANASSPLYPRTAGACGSRRSWTASASYLTISPTSPAKLPLSWTNRCQRADGMSN